jgi:hypothetical protein
MYYISKYKENINIIIQQLLTKLRTENAINRTYFILATLYGRKFANCGINQVTKILRRYNYVV